MHTAGLPTTVDGSRRDPGSYCRLGPRVNIYTATGADVYYVMHDLRDTPDLEMISEEALRAAIKTSTYAWIAEIDGDPVAVWGFYKPSLLADEGFIWMVTTNAVEEHQFTFIRYGRMVLDMMFQKCNLLYGVVHPDFHRSHRFLKFFKFEIGDPVNFNGKFMLVFKRSK